MEKTLTSLLIRINLVLVKLNLRKRSKVNLFIVGAQKAGTTSLFNYLSKSNEVAIGNRKEIGFFTRSNVQSKGKVWYENQFLRYIFKRKILLDATPEYLYYPKVSTKLYGYNNEAKIIIILRDPVHRAYSHYNMFKNIASGSSSKIKKLKERWKVEYPEDHIIHNLFADKNFPSFREFINSELNKIDPNNLEPSILSRGLYYNQIMRYFKIFPLENILILDSQNLKTNTINCLYSICEFLDIKNDFISYKKFSNKHMGNYENKISKTDFDFLKDYYKSPNENLTKLIDNKFEWI